MENDIVTELINIEQMASAVLDKLSEDQSLHQQQTKDEIASRIAGIETDAQNTINSLYKAAAVETDAKIAEIEKDSRRGASLLEKAFENNRERWRAALVNKILYEYEETRV